MTHFILNTFALVVATSFTSTASARPSERAPASAEAKYEYAPFTLWIAPHVSSAGILSDRLKTNVALSLGVSGYARLEGVDLGVGASWVKEDVRGTQITAGLNYVGTDMTGVQITAGANITEGRVTGLQTSAALSYAGEVAGAQLSLVNIGGHVTGAQVGLVNVADTVEGTQLGLVNVASESDTPFGLFNFVRNGQHHLELWGSETTPLNLALKLGGKTIYSVLTVGLESAGTNKRWMAGLGLGAHFTLDERIYLETELIASHINEAELWSTGLNTLTSLRVLFGYELVPNLTVFGGPTLNLHVADRGRSEDLGLIQGLRLDSEGSDHSVRLWPGLVAGLRI